MLQLIKLLKREFDNIFNVFLNNNNTNDKDPASAIENNEQQ